MSVILKRFEKIETSDPDELVEALEDRFGPVKLDMLGRNAALRCRLTFVPFGGIGIVHGQYESGFKVRFSDFNAFVGSPAPLRGVGVHEIAGREVRVRKGAGIAVSPGPVTLHYGSNFEHLSVSIPPALLVGKLAAILDGELSHGALRFEPAVNGRDTRALRLDRLIRFVVGEIDLAWPISPIMQAELQDTLLAAFLLANPSNYSTCLNGEPAGGAPWQVDRAEQFIEAHWDQPITIEGLAAATNVSVRSLFSAFKASRGYTPMEFVKRVRLDRAREKLSHPEDEHSVATVAFGCGFGNLGHFAVDYRRQFGEQPSETLRRGRGTIRVGNAGSAKHV
jgi:AraC-like DNA-binding protein